MKLKLSEGQRPLDQVADDQQQRDDHRRRHAAEKPLGDRLLPLLAAHKRGLGKHGVRVRAHFFRMPRTIKSAVRLTTKVMVNSSTPVRNSTR